MSRHDRSSVEPTGVPLLAGAALGLLAFQTGFRTVQSSDTAGPGINLLLALLAAGALLLSPPPAGSAPVSPGLRRLRLAAWGWAAWVGVATLAAPFTLPSVVTAAWLALLPFLLVRAAGLGDDGPREGLHGLLLGLAAALAAYGIFQYLVVFPMTLKAVGLDPTLVRAEDEARVEWMARLNSFEIFGTFLTGNAFACFLGMFLPPALARMVEERRRLADPDVRRSAAARLAVQGAGVGLLAGAMYLTKSKGGWLATGAGLAAFAFLAAWRFRPAWRRGLTAAAAVAALAGAGLVAGPLRPDRVGATRLSAEYRLGYWGGALAMAKGDPLTGVGPGRFEVVYPRVKPEGAQETKRAHNDYLQLAAELGLPGLIAYLVIWGLFLVNTFTNAEGAEEKQRPQRQAGWGWWRWGLPAAGLLGVSAAQGVSGMLQETPAAPYATGAGVLALAGLFMWAYLPGRGTGGGARFDGASPFAPAGATGDRHRRLATVGCAAGAVVFLAHTAIDFDLYIFDLAQCAFLLAGLALAGPGSPTGLSEPSRAPTLPRSDGSGLAARLARVTGAILLVGMGLAWIPGMMRAEAALDDFREHVRRMSAEPSLAREHLQGALAAAETAIRESPRDERPFIERGQLRWQLGRMLMGANAFDRAVAMFDEAKADFDAALARRPEDPPLARQRAQAIFDRAAALEAIARTPAGAKFRPLREAARNEAEAAMREAVRLYPSRPRTRLDFADLLAAYGKTEEAKAECREALRLGGLHVNPRMKLRPEEEARARAGAGLVPAR